MKPQPPSNILDGIGIVLMLAILGAVTLAGGAAYIVWQIITAFPEALEQFTPRTISLLLVVCVVLWIAIKGFFSWCSRRDREWAERNPAPDSVERQREIAAAHVVKRMPTTTVTVWPKIPVRSRYATKTESEGGEV